MSDELEKEKVILENLYRCRDIEIKNLWQKSIFLGPILTLCFTGYGSLLSSMITAKEETLFKYNFLCFGICFISIIFSMLWIYMFKGSKAHYELYERAITDFERNQFQIEEKFVMGKFKYSIPIDEKIFSTNAGVFSPSRINIVIGQVNLVLWILGFIVHIFFMLKYSFTLGHIFIFTMLFFNYIFNILCLILLLSYSLLKDKIKSSYLK